MRNVTCTPCICNVTISICTMPAGLSSWKCQVQSHTKVVAQHGQSLSVASAVDALLSPHATCTKSQGTTIACPVHHVGHKQHHGAAIKVPLSLERIAEPRCTINTPVQAGSRACMHAMHAVHACVLMYNWPSASMQQSTYHAKVSGTCIKSCETPCLSA